MTVFNMISDGYEEVVEKKDKKAKRKKRNKYEEFSRQGIEISEPAKDEDGDTEPYKEFPVELLEDESHETEVPRRIPVEQLRVLYTIFLNSSKAGNPIYKAVIEEVKTYLKLNSVKLISFDIQEIVVYARLRENVMEYYCRIPTKNFDIVGEIELSPSSLSQSAEL